jgi:hypothetical protein
MSGDPIGRFAPLWMRLLWRIEVTEDSTGCLDFCFSARRFTPTWLGKASARIVLERVAAMGSRVPYVVASGR